MPTSSDQTLHRVSRTLRCLMSGGRVAMNNQVFAMDEDFEIVAVCRPQEGSHFLRVLRAMDGSDETHFEARPADKPLRTEMTVGLFVQMVGRMSEEEWLRVSLFNSMNPPPRAA